MGKCKYCEKELKTTVDGVCATCANKKDAVHRLFLICQKIKQSPGSAIIAEPTDKRKKEYFSKTKTEDGVIKMSLLEFGEFIDKVWEDSVKDFAKVLVEHSENNQVNIGDIPDLVREVLGVKK